MADYCSLCGCIGHCKTFCSAPPHLVNPECYRTSLRGYVYPRPRKLVSASPVSGTSGHSINPLPSCTGDTGSVLYLQGASSASTAPPILGLPPCSIPLKLADGASLPTKTRPHSFACRTLSSLDRVLPRRHTSDLPSLLKGRKKYLELPIWSLLTRWFWARNLFLVMTPLLILSSNRAFLLLGLWCMTLMISITLGIFNLHSNS